MIKLISTVLCAIVILTGCSTLERKIEQLYRDKAQALVGKHYSEIDKVANMGLVLGDLFASTPSNDGGMVLKYQAIDQYDGSTTTAMNGAYRSADKVTRIEYTFFKVDARGIIRDWARGQQKLEETCRGSSLLDYGIIIGEVCDDRTEQHIDAQTNIDRLVFTSSGQPVSTWYR